MVKEIIGTYSDVEPKSSIMTRVKNSENIIPAYSPIKSAKKLKSSITKPFLKPFQAERAIKPIKTRSNKFTEIYLLAVFIQRTVEANRHF